MRRRLEPAPTPTLAPNWLVAGPVGDDLLQAWREHVLARREWERREGLTVAQSYALAPGRGPRRA